MPKRRTQKVTELAWYVLLVLVERGPVHCYELVKQVEQRCEGVIRVSPTNVYEMLLGWEKYGFVEKTQIELPGLRKYNYTITSTGRNYLAGLKERVDLMVKVYREAVESREI